MADTSSDKVFLRAFRWFKAAVDRLETSLPTNDLVNQNLKANLPNILRTRLGLALDKTDASIDPATFATSNAKAQSLALATMVVGESLAALRVLGTVLSNIADGKLGLDDLSKIIQQVEHIIHASAGTSPSAYSLAKMLLILSGDVDQPESDPPAGQLASLVLGGSPSSTAKDDAQMILGLAIMVAGTIIDRSFDAPGAPQLPPLSQPDLSSLSGLLANQLGQTFKLPGSDPKKQLGLAFGLTPVAQPELLINISSALNISSTLGDALSLAFSTNDALGVQVGLLPLGQLTQGALDALPKLKFTKDVEISLTFGRTSTATPWILGATDKTHLAIGDLSGGITLNKTVPQVELNLKNTKLVLKVGDDSLLSAVLGDKIEVDASLGLIADAKGGVRLKDGTGLKTTIPIQKISNSPIQVQFLTFELTTGKQNSLDEINVELSGSFKVDIGPFSGTIDRLGSKLNLKNLLKGGTPVSGLGLKPPSGLGLTLDTSMVKGGGFLLFDPDRGEYGGVLDVKLMQIGVKAIGVLSTKNPSGWSLLLIITAQLPAVQLGFGFTLTGVGGLIGVQHTTNTQAISTGLASGSLDNFLFPKDPVANAPQIINQLRTIFPFKAGGFVIGPMLELGWGTPSLVTARLGVLIEATQIVIVGQVIVQLPPLASKSLSLLYLQMDIVGGVVFNPLKFWMDGILRDSRVMFISLTGQFAFRALFGSKPSFLFSAGGFHPRFTDIPPDVPAPFERVGASFSIGIIGLEFKGYFAVTSATVQGGASLHVWANIGIASLDGGFEFNAIIYIVPKFHFEVDVHVWAGVKVFGLNFASVDLYGELSGPGLWHITGRATIHTPWPLPNFHIDINETWGTDRATTVRKLRLLDELKNELEAIDDQGTPLNWAAALPAGNDAFVTLVKLPPEPGLLAHPNAVLQFTQKRMPLAKKLDKLSSDEIEGDDKQIAISKVRFGSVEVAPSQCRQLDDNFAIAQFLNVQEDDLLSKPSFERFESGLEVGQSEYLSGANVPDLFDYEEVNLSTPSAIRQITGAGLLNQAHLVWLLDLGAAGRSRLRAKGLRLPPPINLAVNPAPLQTLDVMTGTMSGAPLTGRAATGYWQAQDVLAASGKRNLQVVEIFETII
jgi:hypothetical protein